MNPSPIFIATSSSRRASPRQRATPGTTFTPLSADTGAAIIKATASNEQVISADTGNNVIAVRAIGTKAEAMAIAQMPYGGISISQTWVPGPPLAQFVGGMPSFGFGSGGTIFGDLESAQVAVVGASAVGSVVLDLGLTQPIFVVGVGGNAFQFTNVVTNVPATATPHEPKKRWTPSSFADVFNRIAKSDPRNRKESDRDYSSLIEELVDARGLAGPEPKSH